MRTGRALYDAEQVHWLLEVRSFESRLTPPSGCRGLSVDFGEPRVLEPDKVDEWRCVSWSRIPKPIFTPTESLLATAWEPGSSRATTS